MLEGLIGGLTTTLVAGAVGGVVATVVAVGVVTSQESAGTDPVSSSETVSYDGS